MTDYIYNSITEIPDEVLKSNIKTMENVIANIVKRKGNVEVVENIRLAIRRWKDELVRRYPADSLYMIDEQKYREQVRLEAYSITQLRKIGKLLHIPNYSRMPRGELIDAILCLTSQQK